MQYHPNSGGLVTRGRGELMPNALELESMLEKAAGGR
jgi:hypothetical protein